MLCGFAYGGSLLLGGEKEVPLPIPSFLQGAQIVFTKPMLYQIGDPQEGTRTFRNVQREIVGSKFLNQYMPGHFTYEPVPQGMKFSVVKAFNLTPYGLLGGEVTTAYLILQDQNGQRSFIPEMNFTTELTEDGELTNVHPADYFLDGQDMGAVSF